MVQCKSVQLCPGPQRLCQAGKAEAELVQRGKGPPAGPKRRALVSIWEIFHWWWGSCFGFTLGQEYLLFNSLFANSLLRAAEFQAATVVLLIKVLRPIYSCMGNVTAI